MKNLKGKNLTLYERIEELEKSRTQQDDIFVSHPSHPSQDVLSLCNNSDKLRDTSETVSVPQVSRSQEPTPKQDPYPVPVPDAVKSDLVSLEDCLTAMYTVKLEAIAKIYYESNGDYAWLKENAAGAYLIINESEDKLNKVWLQCLNGKSTMQDFERALTAWYRANIQGIKLSVSKQVESREQQLALW